MADQRDTIHYLRPSRRVGARGAGWLYSPRHASRPRWRVFNVVLAALGLVALSCLLSALVVRGPVVEVAMSQGAR